MKAAFFKTIAWILDLIALLISLPGVCFISIGLLIDELSYGLKHKF